MKLMSRWLKIQIPGKTRRNRTPTSDEERTKIRPETSRLLMIINAYSGEKGLQEAVEYSKTLLHKYALIENSNDVFLKMY